MTVRIGVDTGGTFTDIVMYDEATGETYVTKTPSTPSNFAAGVLTGIQKILDETGTSPGSVSFLTHGTTVGTNAALENELPKMGLITNDGLRDVLEIGDQTRPEIYNFFTDKPPSLIPRYLRKEVPGRIDANGEEVTPLGQDRVRNAVTELVEEGVEAIVVSMLFSYLNEDHEQETASIIDSIDANLSYALSSEVHPEIREYDRTITTVINEGIKTTVQGYLEELDAEVKGKGIDSPLNIMHSGGGIFPVEHAITNAVRTILSGPAGGAVAVSEVSQREGFENAIGMDMGGTSADVSITRGGELVRTTEGRINNLPIKMPMIDVATVGAGGGSIAWIDEGGALRVGPKSAGADPGPICYGKGGQQPTVTDANLLLGRLNPDNFLGGEMALTIDETRQRFQEAIAEPLGQSLEQAATNVLEIANASLARNIRTVTVERGEDPGEFSLVAFGGAGPLQAPTVAIDMGIDTVIIPRNPGVFSARGLLIADVRVDSIHSYRGDDPDVEILKEQFEELEADLIHRLEGQEFEAQPSIERLVDMRYAGQSYEITVPVPSGPIDDATLAETVDRFHSEHQQLYGHATPEEPVEIVTLRANGLVPTPTFTETVEPPAADARVGEREVYFDDVGFVPAEVYNRYALSVGTSIQGPAILEEKGSTSIIPPNTSGVVSEYGNVIISLGQ